MRKLTVIAILMLLLTGACIQVAPPTNTAIPEITSFSASPAVVTIGQSSTLVWNVINATSAGIEPAIGGVPESGSEAVTPANTTAYKLTASNAYGTATATVTVTVNPTSAPPVTNSFTVSPAVIQTGQTAALQWSVSGANTVNIQPGIGNVSASGSEPVSPASTTTYILTASNAAGIITSSTTLSVVAYLPPNSTYFGYPIYPAPTTTGVPVIVSFAAYPPVISYGEASTLSWDVSGASIVTISQGIGEVAPVDSRVVTPYTTTYYTLTATNGVGSSYASTTITVYPLNTYPNYPFMYPFRYPTYPVIPQPQQPVFPQPHQPPFPRSSDNFSGGQGFGDHRGMLPRINFFNSSPTHTDVGRQTELRWNVNGATSISIDQGVGDVPSSGTKAVTPNHTTVYTITASNATGEVQHSQEVIVPRTMDLKKLAGTGGN
jgi:hypothetical protein